jgi:hypothetical protein
LRRLSDQCNLVLTTASIVGREFDFGMLGIVMEDVSEIELLDVVDEALEAHLVEATLAPATDISSPTRWSSRRYLRTSRLAGRCVSTPASGKYWTRCTATARN